MSDLTSREKRKLERLFGMGSGYVLNFSNRTFADFIDESTGRNISDSRYSYGSSSKANQLRGFWLAESNQMVGTLIGDLPFNDSDWRGELLKDTKRWARGGPPAGNALCWPAGAFIH